MGLRIVVFVAVLALTMLAQFQVAQVSGPRGSDVGPAISMLDRQLSSVAVADNHDDADNDDADNDDADNDDIDNDDSDNDDADNDDSDNDDADNDDSDNDSNATPTATISPAAAATSNAFEDRVIENVSPSAPAAAAPAAAKPAPAPAPAAPAPPPAAAPAPVAPPPAPSATEASGTTAGADATIALPNNHVAVQVFPSMPAGIVLTIRLIDPVTVPAAPGTRVGDLVFVFEARDGTGAPLTTLPAEVNLGVVYTDRDTGGLDDQTVTLSWLDPVSNQWITAPKILSDPASNVLTASVMDLGTYVVSIP